MWAVTEQPGVSRSDRKFAEFKDGMPIVHRSKIAALAAVRPVAIAMGMPPDREPSIWGNISVHYIPDTSGCVIIKD
jgi:hypothetical protein